MGLGLGLFFLFFFWCVGVVVGGGGRLAGDGDVVVIEGKFFLELNENYNWKTITYRIDGFGRIPKPQPFGLSKRWNSKTMPQFNSMAWNWGYQTYT